MDTIVKQITLKASRQRVWRALSDSTEFGTWFGVKFEGPFQAGQRIRGVMVGTAVDAAVAAAQKPHEGMPFEIEVDTIEPERLFAFRWHPYAIDPQIDYSQEPTTLVSFEVEMLDDGQVRLTVTESGFERIPLERRAKAFAANEGGWGIMIKMIEAYLAAGNQ